MELEQYGELILLRGRTVEIMALIHVKVIHKEYSRFLNHFSPTPYLYHELKMIIYTSDITI